ncbi:MAG: PD-(D/E)XK nuclease-like domain-containing protein [Lachnospiraceae bacterium]|nr:PD-(D/E)XK nuclease-like domain-containing protein [Bacteroides fragilis]MCM1219000.1 PD-(D/E)XK nuclease-like domain-containing protein [Lachnospiraceae bacterium]
MELTESNYYSAEADWTFWSVSQYKSFMRCESAAMAELRGEYKRPVTDALLLGSYLDSWMDGTLEDFKKEHPELFTKAGNLKAEYRKSDEAIAKISTDELFMKYISGEHQKILTFELCGVPWKAKLDSFHEGICIVDLKYVRNYDSLWKYRYDIQGAVYAYGAEACGYGELPFYLAAVTKETIPDCDIFQVLKPQLDIALKEVTDNMERLIAVKEGLEEPTSCGTCDYCKTVKKASIRDFSKLLL